MGRRIVRQGFPHPSCRAPHRPSSNPGSSTETLKTKGESPAIGPTDETGHRGQVINQVRRPEPEAVKRPNPAPGTREAERAVQLGPVPPTKGGIGSTNPYYANPVPGGSGLRCNARVATYRRDGRSNNTVGQAARPRVRCRSRVSRLSCHCSRGAFE